jgi:hypothetical protein
MTGLAHCHQSMRIDMSAPGESRRRIPEPVRRSTHRKLAQAPRARPFAFTNPIRTHASARIGSDWWRRHQPVTFLSTM